MASSSGIGSGSTNSSSSCVIAAGTAPKLSNQCFATDIISGVSGHSFQFPNGSQAKTSQGYSAGILARIMGSVICVS